MRPRNLPPQLLLALATLLIVAGLLPYVLSQRPAPAEEVSDLQEQSEPAPAIDSLVSIALPQSQLVIQNLESDRPIDLDIDLWRADGSTATQLHFDAVPPLSPRVIALADLPDLPVGIYSASVRGSGKLAALARHAWPVPGDDDRENLAISTASEPAQDLVIPYLAISGTSESAILSVQNTDPDAAAQVDIVLVPFAAEGAAPAWEGRIELAAGGSASLDLAGPGFDDLIRSFRGFAWIRADRPLAGAGLIVRGEGDRQANAALEAIPAGKPAPRIQAQFATRFEEIWPNNPAGMLALVNPGQATETLRLHFRSDDPALWRCDPEPLEAPAIVLAAGAGILLRTDEAFLPGLRPDCVGLVEVETEGSGVLAASLRLGDPEDRDLPGLAVAYPLANRPALRLALPWLLDGGQGSGWVWAMNAGDAPVRAEIEARDRAGRQIALQSAARLDIPAGRSGFRSLGSDHILEPLAGLLQADGPLEALLSEQSGFDAAAYMAPDPEEAGPDAYTPFLARPPVWPTQPAFYTPAPNPTASPTRVTVVPPAPRPEPTLAAPAGLISFDIPRSEDWIDCCVALAWPRPEELWGVDFGDGVPLDVSRFNPSAGQRLGGLPAAEGVERFARTAAGEFLGLTSGWTSKVLRLDSQGRRLGEIRLPAERDWELKDLAAAPDGSIWLVDNQHYDVHHLAASGNHLATWPYYEALRHPGDGGYRIAISPEGDSVWLLTWTRLLRFSSEGSLLTAIGAPHFELGPEDFRAPMDLAVDAAGRAYVIEGTGRLRVFEADGWEVARWQAFAAPQGSGTDGDWVQAALALGPAGELAVSELPAYDGSEPEQAVGRIHIFAPLDARSSGPTATRGPFRGFLPFARSRE